MSFCAAMYAPTPSDMVAVLDYSRRKHDQQVICSHREVVLKLPASLRAADCVVKPRRCAVSSAFYALSATRMKTDHFSKPLCGGYIWRVNLSQRQWYALRRRCLLHMIEVWLHGIGWTGGRPNQQYLGDRSLGKA